jgi:hypothetical protein
MVLIQILKARIDWWAWRIVGVEFHSCRWRARRSGGAIMSSQHDKSIIKLLFSFQTIFADSELSQRESLFPQSSLSYGNFFQFQRWFFFVSVRAMLKAKNGENKKERREMKCVSHVNENLIRIAMIYERLWSDEVHADDYYLCHISDYKQPTNSQRSPMSHNFNFLS